jgi:flavin-dependent dehydrogenase
MLLERARAAGAEFRVAQAREIVWHDGRASGVVVGGPANEAWIETGTVITATGASLGARLLGGLGSKHVRTWGIAGRAYMAVEGSGDHLEIHFPIVHEQSVLPGYGWVFPMDGRSVNVGVGVFQAPHTRGPSIRNVFEAFLRERARGDRRWGNARRLGAFASGPISLGPRVELAPNVLPVGDAAGLANPFTAEGISAALESGELAAHAVAVNPRSAADLYGRTTRSRFAARFRFGPALAAMYAQSWLLLGRGRDAVLADNGALSRSLHRVIWDEPATLGRWQELDDRFVREIIEMVESHVVRAGWRLRPLIGELVGHLVKEREADFGWYAAFGAAVRASTGARGRIDPEALSPLIVLEMLNIVAVLHNGLLAVPSRGTSGVWGRNTLALTVADCLTACAGQHIARMNRAWTKFLGRAMSGFLRHNAELRMGDRPTQSRLRDSVGSLLVAAAYAGAAIEPHQSLPPVVMRAAHLLACLRMEDTRLLWSPQSMPGPLRSVLLLAAKCFAPEDVALPLPRDFAAAATG